jgi:hypothetical protein
MKKFGSCLIRGMLAIVSVLVVWLMVAVLIGKVLFLDIIYPVLTR